MIGNGGFEKIKRTKEKKQFVERQGKTWKRTNKREQWQFA